LSELERKKLDKKARGLILRFHRWPSLKEQRELNRILNSSGLKRTKNIKSFKAQLFFWKEGGLKPSILGESACKKLENLSYMRRCSPDHLLPVNQTSVSKFLLNDFKSNLVSNSFSGGILLAKSKGTEADFNFKCEDCKNEELNSIGKVTQKALNIKTCDIVSHKRNLKWDTLSDYWAQELIGSDLLREELEKVPDPNIENWIAVFDTKDVDHNIHVKNLISDWDRHAVLPGLWDEKTSSTIEFPKLQGYRFDALFYETKYPGEFLFRFKGRAPHYINISMSWHESKDILEALKSLSSAKVSPPIIVNSSGNRFPKKLDDMEKKASQDFDMILVGSFSPSGFVSDFSQSGEEISILAPSDYWITSAGKDGEYIRFSGTSGATPLVTGSLAGFEWLSGYHPTAKEAKTLLEKTALPTLHSFEKPRINGAGLLNAYKLGEVAKRLKEICKDRDTICFKEEILKDENYHFPEDESLKRDLARVFPLCFEGEELALSNCEEKKEGFKRLRREVLLNPSEELLKSLSIYKEGGLIANAEALDRLSMALRTEGELREELIASLKKEDVSDNELRLILGMGGFEEEFSYSDWIRGLGMIIGMGEKALPFLKTAFVNTDHDLRMEAMYSSIQLGETAIPLLNMALESDDLESQLHALSLTIEVGETALPFLQKAFDSGIREL
ncbi:MAG: S8/S53 family peptidase, partial [Bdellovibrionaceae bacterium]|nr:S8/S53 family peptidase [Pseudobdellovibrionaceae bacterium]